MKPSINKGYLTLFLLVLVAEITIAVFGFHRFIRGFLGDVLVIPLLYSFLRAFFPIKPNKALTGVLTFALLVELLQFFELSKWLGLNDGIIRTVLGTTYDIIDLLAYALGGFLTYIIQSRLIRN